MRQYKIQEVREIEKIIWEKIKEINKTLPTYKYIKHMILTNKELIKTTTKKIKRNEEMKLVFSAGEEIDYEEVKLIDFTGKSEFEVIFYLKQHHFLSQF